MRHHLNHLAITVGLVLAAVLVSRIDLRTALPYALLLAWPLGMIGIKRRLTQQGDVSAATPVETHQQASGRRSNSRHSRTIHEETAPRFVQPNTP